jgi:hypothetical protein
VVFDHDWTEATPEVAKTKFQKSKSQLTWGFRNPFCQFTAQLFQIRMWLQVILWSYSADQSSCVGRLCHNFERQGCFSHLGFPACHSASWLNSYERRKWPSTILIMYEINMTPFVMIVWEYHELSTRTVSFSILIICYSCSAFQNVKIYDLILCESKRIRNVAKMNLVTSWMLHSKVISPFGKFP